MKQTFFFFLIAWLITINASSQCNTTIDYAPTIQDHYPVKRIRIMFHILQKNDGTGNFQNTTLHRAFLNQVLIHLEGLNSSNEAPSNTSEPHLADTKIRYVSDVDFQFHPDDNTNNADYNSVFNTSVGDGDDWNKTDEIHKKYVIDNNIYSNFEKYN